jgi:hypothetical protein
MTQDRFEKRVLMDTFAFYKGRRISSPDEPVLGSAARLY